MKLGAFRIKNYRSIVDTGWKNLSADNITGLIGQNEAGKTTVLEALLSFSTGKISEDILRSDQSLPEVSCSFQLSTNEVNRLPEIPPLVREYLHAHPRVNLVRTWDAIASSTFELEEKTLKDVFTQAEVLADLSTGNDTIKESAGSEENPEGEEINEPTASGFLSEDEFANALAEIIPRFELFRDNSSLLPDQMDLDDLRNKNSKALGITGVQNLVLYADIDIDYLDSASDRFVATRTDHHSDEISADFREFWKQKVGRTNKIAISFELKRHTEREEGKAGKPYLVFFGLKMVVSVFIQSSVVAA